MEDASLDVLRLICMPLSVFDLCALRRTCKRLKTALDSKKLADVWHWKYLPIFEKTILSPNPGRLYHGTSIKYRTYIKHYSDRYETYDYFICKC